MKYKKLEIPFFLICDVFQPLSLADIVMFGADVHF